MRRRLGSMVRAAKAGVLWLALVCGWPGIAWAQDANETIKLAKEAQPILEELAQRPDPRFQAPAERLLEAIPKAVITPRQDEAPDTRHVIEANVEELVDAARADPLLQTEGFRCLEARSACQVRGHRWLDCELAMVVCMFSQVI